MLSPPEVLHRRLVQWDHICSNAKDVFEQMTVWHTSSATSALLCYAGELQRERSITGKQIITTAILLRLLLLLLLIISLILDRCFFLIFFFIFILLFQLSRPSAFFGQRLCAWSALYKNIYIYQTHFKWLVYGTLKPKQNTKATPNYLYPKSGLDIKRWHY